MKLAVLILACISGAISGLSLLRALLEMTERHKDVRWIVRGLWGFAIAGVVCGVMMLFWRHL